MIDPAAPAQRLMIAVEDHFAAAGVDLPARKYLLAGNAAGGAWDDEQVTVSLNTVLPGPAQTSSTAQGSPGRQVGTVLARAVYEIRILRCWPTVDDHGDPPTADTITAASTALMRDAGLILTALYTFAAGEPGNATMTVGEIQPLGPDGGLCGYAVVITLSPIE